jgi:hypothetical protein
MLCAASKECPEECELEGVRILGAGIGMNMVQEKGILASKSQSKTMEGWR